MKYKTVGAAHKVKMARMIKWLFVWSTLCFFYQSRAKNRTMSPIVAPVVLADTLVIKISDAGIERPLTSLSITLQDETTGSTRMLPYDPETMAARAVVDSAHRYTVAIDAPNYTPYRKYIAKIEPGQEIAINLQRKESNGVEKKYLISVLDKEQRSVVPNAEVLVFDKDKNLVAVAFEKGQYSVWLPDIGDFTYQVTAKEYESAGGRFQRSETGVVEIRLRRRKETAQTQTIAFVAQDAFTKKPIAARFRLNSGDAKTSATVTTAENPQFGTELKIQQSYLLEVESDGYEKYAAPISLAMKEDEPIKPRVILLNPLAYEVIFAILDATTMKPIDPASFKVGEAGKNLKLQSAGNTRKVSLMPGKNYGIRVDQPGYEVFERTLTFDKPTNLRDLQKSILLTPVRSVPTATATPAPAEPKPAVTAAKVDETVFENLKIGEAVRLDNVYFDQSSYILRTESYPQLDKLVKTLKVNPKLKIEISGHTDNVGDPRLNQFLSENRAKVISSYLTNKGIPETRMIWKGYGQTKPVAANDTEENKAQNRRVEFVVLKN